ncbi:MAG: hypothetical protein PVI01_00130 [Gemmatimonadales bacterium]
MSGPAVIATIVTASALTFVADASAGTGPRGQSGPYAHSATVQAAQVPEKAWNAPRVRELVTRSIERRAGWLQDERLLDYQAVATGHIYFLYDVGANTERHLVKADQLALRLYWRAPDRTRQVIVGRREEKALPTSIRYHLDHLTVVLDNLGDRIRLGEGSEVRDVLHPAAANALDYYDYRLADSLTLELPDREVRVYKVEVRPKDPHSAGVVGAVYLDRSTADIVRMELTFTASSYLDETLDYFNMRLENALWDGKYWLPYRQGIELRRGIDFVQFPAGGIIRAEFRISDYRFNVGTPEGFFRGPRVSALPAAALQTYEFEAGLYDALDPAEAAAPPSLEEIRAEAKRIVAQYYLQPSTGLRPAVPGVSSIFRFRRAEGFYVGPAVGRDFASGSSSLWLGGYAIGAEKWQLFGRIRTPLFGAYDLELSAYLDRVTDVSPWAASSGAIATLAALVAGEDYRDPYWTTGGVVSVGRPWGGSRVQVSAAWEEWRSANLEADANVEHDYRDVRALDTGDVLWFSLRMTRPPPGAAETVGGANWEGRVEAATQSLAGDFEYVRLALRGELVWPRLAVGTGLRLSAAAGVVTGGRIAAQRLLPLGGRGTVPGYRFHDYVGNVHATVGVELSRPLWYPLVSVDLFADAGWAGIEGNSARDAVAVWNRAGDLAGETRGPLVGAGAGVGLLFDILWVEVARGLVQGGRWEVVVRVRGEFWEWL